MYTLLIRRYGRYMSFDTIEELKNEVSGYFTKSEKAIVEKLTTFNSFVDGMAKNDYQDFTTICYK
jgi:hypothetical protein